MGCGARAVNGPPVHPVLTSQTRGGMPRQALSKEVRVDGGTPRQKRRTETRAERGRRLGHASLGARHARRVAREKVVDGLRQAERRDWRQHTERVGRQHHDVARMARRPGCRRCSMKHRIRAARVLGQRVVVEIARAWAGSITTFSSTVPKRRVVAKICGSASADSRISFA